MKIRLALSPHRVALVRMSRGLRPRALAGTWMPCGASSESQPNWASAIAALPELLANAGVRRARATVVLSNHLVRYLVTPRNRELESETEQAEYARARLAQLHGEAAHDWQLRVTSGPAGSSRLVAAVDTALMDALRVALRSLHVSLASCQPALTALVDGARSLIDDDAWVVNAERGRLLVARIREGQWNSVRSRPLGGGPLALRELLAQERMLVPGEDSDCRVFLNATDNVEIDASGVRAHPIVAGIRARLAPELRSNVALALAGMP